MKYFAILCLTSTAFAYTPDYFPLQVGNQWVYRVTSGVQSYPATVSVTGTQSLRGEVYAVVEGLAAAPVLLRQDANGRLLALNPAAGESPWAEFATPEGGEYLTATDPCSTKAKVASRNATVSTPVGTYSGALEVTYSGPCADAGITQDHYLPWIGLVRRMTTTIAGPRVWELVYSRTGGVTVLSQPETAFSLSLARNATLPLRGFLPQLEARMTLRVTTAPLELTFPTSQRFEIKITNEQGEVVYFSSALKLYAQVVGKEVIGPGERNWAEEIPLNHLPAGRYVVAAWLTTVPATAYSASVPFDIPVRF